MTVYTVHEPPLRRNETAPAPERFAFVRDGFYFWAFLLPPLWMLRHRLWLGLIGYLIVAGLLLVALRLLGASDTATFAVFVLLSLLVGLEAASLRRWTLGRRKWVPVGVVVGDTRDSAERRFFDNWTEGHAAHSRPANAAAAPPESFASASMRMPHPAAPEVVGLFPEPGARS